MVRDVPTERRSCVTGNGLGSPQDISRLDVQAR
jgi:hypothetical protein